MNKSFSFKKKLITVAVASCSMAGFASAAFAEDGKSANEVDEILVTATKRTTSLQDTPLAISAITGDSLKENNVTDVTGLVGSVPSMQFRMSPDHGAPQLFIRGMGTQNQTEAGDSAVAFYVDGVFAARAQGATVMAFDLDRAEVLRGPQGTLFGRNSTAGAVSLITAKPKLGEFEGSGDLVVGNHDRQGTQVMLNVPVTDDWALRIAAATEKKAGETENTGHYTDAATGRKFMAAENYGGVDLAAYRISSLWKPSEDFSWNLSVEKFKNNGTGDVPTLDYDHRSVAAPAPGSIDLDSTNIRTRIDYSFASDLTLSYIGGSAKFDQSQLHGDLYGNLAQTVWSNYKGTQHELQLANSDDNRFRWTIGAFAFKEENGIRFDIPHNSGWGSGLGNDEENRLSTFIQPNRTLESSSFYGQGTFDVTDDFRITGGLRYTDDTREDKGGRSVDCNYVPDDLSKVFIYKDTSFVPAGTAHACYNRQYNDMKWAGDATTYLARVEWDYTDDVMFFLSNGNGWKSGVVQDGNGWSGVAVNPANANSAYNWANNNALVQDPEKVVNTELGMKAQFGKLTLNANAFYMDFTDMQVTATTVNPATNQAIVANTNAGKASIKGIEAEATYLVGDAGTLTASLSLLDATYDEFASSETSYDAVQGQQWNPCALGTVGGAGTACKGVGGTALYNYAGNHLPYAPEVSYNIGYKHEFSLASGGSLTPRIRVTYSGDYYFGQENRGDRAPKTIDANDPGAKSISMQDAYTKVDLGLTYKAPSENWSADFYVDNATDEAIKNSQGSRTGYQYAYVWNESTSYGLRLNYKLK